MKTIEIYEMNQDTDFIHNDYEYEIFDGYDFVNFHILALNKDSNQITLAISRNGKTIISNKQLFEDKNERLYFEYGALFQKIYINQFMEV